MNTNKNKIDFKNWFFENIDRDRNKELKSIWNDTFKSLGVEGLTDEDAAQQSLSRITYRQRDVSDASGLFKGKQAVRKRLENGQIFNRLDGLNDPEIRKNVELVKRWLDTKDDQNAANGSTTVSTLLQRLFGQRNFELLLNSKLPQQASPKPQVELQPPKPCIGMQNNLPQQQSTQMATPEAPISGYLRDQPAV